MLVVFDNDSISTILHVRSRDCPCLTTILAQIAQKRLRRFGYAARRVTSIGDAGSDHPG